MADTKHSAATSHGQSASSGMTEAPLCDDKIALARTLWNERQEDCAKYGADLPMPHVTVRVDVFVNLFDALTVAVDNLQQTTRGRFFGWECSEQDLLAEARAAIAAAEGRSSQSQTHKEEG